MVAINQQSRDVEKIRLFVAKLMNDEQSKHAQLISDLHAACGKTKEYDDIVRVLNQIYEAKSDLLDKIYKEIQSI